MTVIGKIPPRPISDKRAEEIRNGSRMTPKERLAWSEWAKEAGRIRYLCGKLGGRPRHKKSRPTEPTK